MLDSNVLQPSVDWPCDLLSPANVLYRFENLASYRTFFDSVDKPLGKSWHNASFLVDAENVQGNGNKAHTEGWRIFDRINWIKRENEPDENALPVRLRQGRERVHQVALGWRARRPLAAPEVFTTIYIPNY